MAAYEFHYSDSFDVTPEVQIAFDHNGFIIVRKLFDDEEIEKIKWALEGHGLVENYSYGIRDRHGHEPRLMIWSNPGDDVTGMVPRCEKVVNTCEKLLGGDELYHYHTKIVMKEPKKGGSFEWHQDYGAATCRSTITDNGLLERGSSSMDSQPSLKQLNHYKSEGYDRELHP